MYPLCYKGDKYKGGKNMASMTITLKGHIIQVSPEGFMYEKPFNENHFSFAMVVFGYLVKYPITPFQRKNGLKFISKL